MKYQQLILTLLLICLALPLVSSSLGTFKTGDCVPIRVLANCTSVNLTEVTVNNNFSYVINSAMTHLGGQTFNYTFCNTSAMGTYTYSWDNTCVDCSQGDCGNSFLVNGSGQDVSQAQITLIIIGLVVLLIVGAFFFILSLLFKHPGTKIFLMALSCITLIVIIGMIAANATVYLAEFSNLVMMHNTYYTLFTILAGAAMRYNSLAYLLFFYFV